MNLGARHSLDAVCIPDAAGFRIVILFQAIIVNPSSSAHMIAARRCTHSSIHLISIGVVTFKATYVAVAVSPRHHGHLDDPSNRNERNRRDCDKPCHRETESSRM